MSNEFDYKSAYEAEAKKNKALEILFEQKTYELYVLNEKLKQSQKTIIKSEKLASIGRLAAGIAHEINNPLSFVSSNIDLILKVFELDLESDEGRGEFNEFREDLPELKEDILEGLERIRNIINNVNNYTRTKELERQEMNLDQAILSSLHLIKNRLIGKVNLNTNLSKIPNVFGNLNEIKQVILNLLVNAAAVVN